MESEFVLDEMQTTDSSAVMDTSSEEGGSSQLTHHQPGLLRQIIGFFFQTPASRERERSRRLNELNVSIEFSPDSATNYVLRGELFLERKAYHLGQSDFETALELAEAFKPEEGWGLIEQAMRDRALEGLNEANKYL